MQITIEQSDLCDMIDRRELGDVRLGQLLTHYAQSMEERGWDASEVATFANRLADGECLKWRGPRV